MNKTVRPSSTCPCLCPQCLYGDVKPLANHTALKPCHHTLSMTRIKKEGGRKKINEMIWA